MPSIWLGDSYRPRPAVSGDVSSSIVVIGGGLVGVAATYFLAEAGCDVVLLEWNEIASGATGRGNGLLLAGVHHGYAKSIEVHGVEKTRTLWRLSQKNHALMRELIRMHSIDCDYVQEGSYRLAGDSNEGHLIRSSIRKMKECGFRAEEKSPPGWETGFKGGSFFPDNGSLHPVRLVRGLARAAESKGARIFERSKVKRVAQGHIETESGHVRSDMVLFAAGGFSPLLNPFFGETIAPVRGQMLASVPIPNQVIPAPIVLTWGRDHLSQTKDGRLLVGGGRHVAPNREYTYSEKPTDAIQEYLEELIRKRIPTLPELEITHRWAGIVDFSCDELPCVGPLPGTVDRYAAAGFHGSGMTLGLVCAKMVSEMMLEGRTQYPADLFSPRRHL